jgi:hypothetical protein
MMSTMNRSLPPSDIDLILWLGADRFEHLTHA